MAGITKSIPQERKKQVNIIKKSFDSIIFSLSENNTHILDLKGRTEAEKNLLQIEGKLLSKHVDLNHLKTGDVLVSLKSLRYIAQSWCSRAINLGTQSQVAHVSMVYMDGSHPHIIESTSSSKGVIMRPLKISKGEMLIVLRPKLSFFQNTALLKEIRKVMQNETEYSFAKVSGMAPVLLLSGIINIFHRGVVRVPNVFVGRKGEMCCSEFLNELFNKIGFHLTPKSTHSECVLPKEILVSPHIEHIGVLFNETERSVSKIMSQFKEVRI